MELNKEAEADETCATEDREDAIEQQLVQQRGSTPVGLLPPPQATATAAGWDGLSYDRTQLVTNAKSPTSEVAPSVPLVPRRMSCHPSRIDEKFTDPSMTTKSEITPPVEQHDAKKRCLGLLVIPLPLVVGIVLYVANVGTDIWAAVDHFQEGNSLWGSLTITFVILPAICWAAISWTWWFFYDPRKDKQHRRDGLPLNEDDDDDEDEDRNARYRRWRLLLSVLLLDPLVRYL